MKHLKSFEELNFDNCSWTTTRDFLNLYYQCESCNALFKTFNKKMEKCPYCECPDPISIQKDEYYKEQEKKLSGDEVEDMKKEEEEDEVTPIDLISLSNRDKNKKYYN